MASEHNDDLLDRYRASVEAVPESDLDQTILARARHHSAARKFARRTRNALFIAAFAAVAWSFWRSQQLSVAQTHMTDYGKSEGTTRAYLLSAATPAYLGPGTAEGAP